jgi:hypothetical protein
MYKPVGIPKMAMAMSFKMATEDTRITTVPSAEALAVAHKSTSLHILPLLE